MLCPGPDGQVVRRLLISHADRSGEGDWVSGITDYLHQRCVTVERARSGPEAIDLVERGGIDAAILSNAVPRMDGLNLLRAIRWVDASLPCVMVAADASKRTLQQTLALGAYSVVTQPVDVDSLARVVAGLFRKRFEWELDRGAPWRRD